MTELCGPEETKDEWCCCRCNRCDLCKDEPPEEECVDE